MSWRGEIARLARADESLSGLEVTRETVAEILGEWHRPVGGGQEAGSAAAVEGAPEGSPVAGGSPIGVVTVPPWRPGLAQSVLPVLPLKFG